MSVELNLVKNTLTQGKVEKFWKVTAKSKVMEFEYKVKAMGSNLLQPNGDGVFLTCHSQY